MLLLNLNLPQSRRPWPLEEATQLGMLQAGAVNKDLGMEIGDTVVKEKPISARKGH